LEGVAGEIERADMRAADTDRVAVAQRLQQAVDEGRLDIIDFDDRLQRAYAAKTYGELDRLVADLPAPASRTALVKPVDKAVSRRQEMSGEWRSWAGTSLVLITIWGISSVASGGLLFFWPMFPVGIWGAILLASMLEGRSKES
jgi:hypothetical protein